MYDKVKENEKINMSHYIQYYEDQVGEGRGVRHVYAGATYQRGSGIGSFLGSIFRKIVPYIAKGAKAVGKEAVRTGLNVFDDVANNGANFKESFNDRFRESRKNLQRKAANKLTEMMDGSGYKALVVPDIRQSKKGRRSTSSKSKKTKRKKNGGIKKKQTKKKRTVRKKRVKSQRVVEA